MNDEEMLVGFLEEAREHLSTIEPDLLTLESQPDSMETINRLFRSVHSIKGGAGFFGLDALSALAHVMENLLSLARNEQIIIIRPHIDALLSGLDRLNLMIDDIGNSNDVDYSKEKNVLEALIRGEDPFAGAEPEPQAKPAPALSATPAPVAEEDMGEEDEEEEDDEEEEEYVAPIETAIVESSATAEEVVFEIPPEEVERALANDMNLYAVTVYLNRDIMSKGKTPYQFISDLEELGRFIDSFLDTSGTNALGDDAPDGDLRFTFVFASIMAPAVAAEGLTVSEDQIRHVSIEEMKEGKSLVITAPSNIEAAPELKPALTTAPVPAPTVKKKKKKKKKAEVAKEEVQEPLLTAPAPTPNVPTVPTPPSAPAPPPKSASAKTPQKTDESIRVSVGKLNKLVDLAGELVLVRNQLLQVGEKESKHVPGLMGILAGLNIVTTELQEEILNTRMQPVSTVFGKFPRVIRELGQQLGKDILLLQEGGEVELDKTVLEALSDPLTHMIRNTADHGVETPDERRKSGKPPQGKLLLKAYHESGQVIIRVEDDGRGINPEKMASLAYEKGLINDDDFYNLSDRDKVNLVFLPGFSTAEKVTGVSGRGVGMDVVRSNIEMIGGSIDLQSRVGEGTTFKLTLPLTMAIVSCLIVESQGERFAIPQVNLEELVMLKPEEYVDRLGYVQDREVLKLRGELLPLISLASGLGLKEKSSSNYRAYLSEMAIAEGKRSEGEVDKGQGQATYNLSTKKKDTHLEALRILIISVGINKVGVIVDSIVGSEEIVVKPMPEYLKQLTVFSGATILGDGTVAMIIDTLGFVQRNNLFFSDSKRDLKSEDKKSTITESHSLLIFDNGSEEQFAITIPLIQRVDEIQMNQIQRVGGKEYLEYRGQQMRILKLADYLNVSQPDYDIEAASIIIPKETRIPIGILIHKVIDTKTMRINLTEGTIHQEGVLGSTLINGKITLLLDLYALIEMGEPDALHRVEFSAHKVKTSKILLVEDTPLFLTIVKEYLQSVGFTVDTAENGVEGLEALNKEPYDLVLSDIEMPIMDGFQLIKEIRKEKKWEKLPVIALTSLDDDATIKSGLEQGFDEWLVKLDKEKILECMNRYLN